MIPSRDVVSPVQAYTILDIRTPDASANKLMKSAQGVSQHEQMTASGVPSSDVAAPPSPPPSTHPSVEDAFNSADLVDTILDSLDQPQSLKSIPTFVLYDTLGLQLFDQITCLDEYYLTNAERAILQDHADELADRVKNGSIIIELGAGSLKKTELILKAMEKKKKRVTYYALDLDQHELEKSLSSLGGQFNYVQLVGLLGTYEQGIPWLSQQYTSRGTPKVVLWLGSSIGNQSRQESAIFLRRLQRTCLQPGDFCVIGFDRRNDPSIISKAYDDSLGVTRRFIMNGLDHVNVILGQTLFKQGDFDYDSRYQSHHGRHVAHYRANKDLTLTYSRKNDNKNASSPLCIKVEKNELIHVEHSYKYNTNEITHILNAAELDMVEQWLDPQRLYRLVLAECRPFHFERDTQGTLASLFPYDDDQNDVTIGLQEEHLNCATCDTGTSIQQAQQVDVNMAGSLINITGSRHWPRAVPSLHEWEQLWTSWDIVTQTMLNHNTMLFERPIALRHPFIFYLGHIPAFLDIMLTRHHADQEMTMTENQSSGETRLTEPAVYADIFERGIDPDIDDPTQCNPHSEVPEENQDWPPVESILQYQQTIRHRLRKLLLYWDAEGYNYANDTLAWMIPSRQRAARVVWLCFEHEAMHLETLLYMLLQSPNINRPAVAPPAWWYSQKQQQHQQQPSSLDILSPAPMITFDSSTTVQLGHDDVESKDGHVTSEAMEFGWDNEHPKRMIPVSAFEIQSRPVTNGEYWQFWTQQQKGSSEALWPTSWNDNNGDIPKIKTSFGLCNFTEAVNWPVQVSSVQADAYATAMNMRLPTEEEWTLFRNTTMEDNKTANDGGRRDIANIGFASWTPLALNNQKVHVVGDVWEWTSSVWQHYPGFHSSQLYPGYSADFFDGKHRVVLGGSWATHPRIAERHSFRNWYQAAYPYVFSGFRLCRSL